MITENTSNTYINSSSNRNKIVTIGIDNLVIINTHDVTLISSKEMSGDIKLIADHVEKNSNNFNRHLKVYLTFSWIS